MNYEAAYNLLLKMSSSYLKRIIELETGIQSVIHELPNPKLPITIQVKEMLTKLLENEITA